MDLVVDANVIVSCLISFANKTSELFFSDSLHFFAPEYLKDEIGKYKEEIMRKSGFNPADFNLALALLCSKIEFVPFSDFKSFIPEAINVCPDPKDVEYFALALKIHCSFWSNDKKLKGQEKVKVLSTSELLSLF